MAFDEKGRYKRLGNPGKLGAAPGGVVCAAWDSADQKLVAVKEQRSKTDNAERDMRFFRSVPSHPHLLLIHDHFVHGTMLYLVFQYLEATLHDVWARAGGTLDWDRADRYGHHVLQGIAHLHKHVMTHRDLSMCNILFETNTDSVRIADTGLAHCATSRVLEGQVRTLWFTAPEVILGYTSLAESQTFNQWCDMWSAGCVLGALWCGTIVFEAGTEVEVWEKQVSLLGSPMAVWPGVVFLPKWQQFSESTRQTWSPAGPATWGDLTKIRRTLVNRVRAVAVLNGLLSWDPGLRMSADTVLQEDVLWGTHKEEVGQVITTRDDSSPSSVDTSTDGTSLVHVPGEIGNTSPNRAQPAMALEFTPQKKGKRRLPLSNPPPLAKRGIGRPKCVSPAADSIDSALELPPSTALRVEAHPGVCACSGNCGLSTCNRAKALSYSRNAGTAHQSFCLRDVQGTSNYCICCRCEVFDCQRQKNRGRWCGKHASTLGKTELQPGQYLNACGVWAEDPAWSWELKMVAHHGWMLAMMCPSDVTAFVQAADDLVDNSGVLSGHCLLQLWTCAFLKWPHAIDGWTRAVCRSGVVRSAAEYAAASVMMAKDIDTEHQTWMHEQISTGVSNVIFGPVAMLSKLGIMCKPDREPSLSQSVAVSLDNQGEITAELQIGKKQQVYLVSPETSQWQVLANLANDFEGLVLPSNSEEAKQFVTAVCTFLQQFPARYGHGAQHGPTDNHEPSEGYVRKCILRKIILWVQTRTPPEVWEALTLHDMLALTPDKCDLLAPLSADLTCQQMDRVFGCSAYMVSLWACLFHGVKPVNRCMFDVSSDTLWRTVCSLKQDHGMEPSLDTLAQTARTNSGTDTPRTGRRKFKTPGFNKPCGNVDPA
jgi:serine/threonine protein kinase